MPWMTKAPSRCRVCGRLTARRGVAGPGCGLCSGRGGSAGDTGDLIPDGEADGHLGSVVMCGHQMAAGPEAAGDTLPKRPVFPPVTWGFTKLRPEPNSRILTTAAA